MYQTLRLDDGDVDKASDILKRYAAKHSQTKYLLSKEEGADTGKVHLQGWVFHHETAKSFSQYITRTYSHLKGSSKSCKAVDNYTNYIAYIVNNTGKPLVVYENLVTNYTREEIHVIQERKQFIPADKRTPKVKKQYQDEVLDILDEACVIDGKIQYEKLMNVYMNHVPKRLNARILYDNLLGLTVRLEYRYTNNTKARSSLYNQVIRLDDENAIFTNNYSSYLKFQP